MSGLPHSPALEDTLEDFSWTLLYLSTSCLTLSLLAISCALFRNAFLHRLICITPATPLYTSSQCCTNHYLICCGVIPATSDFVIYRVLDHGTAWLFPQRLPFRFALIPSPSRKHTIARGRIGWKRCRRPSPPKRTLRRSRHHRRLSRTFNPFGSFWNNNRNTGGRSFW